MLFAPQVVNILWGIKHLTDAGIKLVWTNVINLIDPIIIFIFKRYSSNLK